MQSECETFVRELDIDLIGKSLRFHQSIVGDVNCVVWDASIVLAKYLEEIYKVNPHVFINKIFLELGAGLGCVGLTAAALGAKVILTDQPDALFLLDKNIKENKNVLETNNGSAQTKELVWGTSGQIDSVPDKILLADCIYYFESIRPLVKTLQDLSGPNTKIILSQEMRESEGQQRNWEYFVDCIGKVFHMDYVPLKEQNRIYSSPDIKLIKLKRKICEMEMNE